MVVPEKEQNIKSLKIPGFIFRAILFISALSIIIIGILAYDYWKILQQVYENKHLNQENRQLREQLQLFQMKLSSFTEDLERIHIFEKKVRIISGLEEAKNQPPLMQKAPDENELKERTQSSYQDFSTKGNTLIQEFQTKVNFDEMKDDEKYTELKNLYDSKIAQSLGIAEDYKFTRNWSELTKRSFMLSYDYAAFDYKYQILKNFVRDLELKVHEIDKNLLDKDSILKSTPSSLPVRGWVTSYFGQRLSPVAGVIKMHEGIDIGAPSGTKITAPADGIVTFSGNKPGFGNFVQIDHGYGIETLYAHASQTIARSGQRINRGTPIALVGNTGYSTGPHLHYEVRVNGIAVDPLYFVID